jgi:uncharacterized membrane protein
VWAVARGARDRPVYRPLSWPLLVICFTLLLALAPLLLAGVSFAFESVGIGPKTAVSLLFAVLLGSWVNIPLWRLPATRVQHEQEIAAFGMRWRVPVLHETPETLLAINLGGAVVPVGVSAWILLHDHRWWIALLATAVVAIVTNRVARPVAGLGIAVPALVPPLTAAGTALLLAGGAAAPAAFVAGTLGTLVGADLLNLRRLSTLGAQIASIGGAGTFDGVFLSGVLAVILAATLR